MLSGLVALLVHLGSSCAPPGRPLIAEILYDSVGDDSGHEFVELFNPGEAPLPLAGVRLEAGDGSGPNRWTLRWTGGARDTIAARGRFVVGGAQVIPAPHAIATLDLQNGPDALRLVFPDGASTVVGYGALELAEYACGEPAVDVPGGQSLARVPDDSDQGSNALDFRPAAPSPGAANQTARDVGIVPGTVALHPQQLEPGAPALLGLSVMNLGLEPIAPLALAIEAHASGDFGHLPLIDARNDREISPGDTVALEFGTAPLLEGRQRIECRLLVAGDERPANDLDSLWIRVGPGPLEITEIQFHPAHDEGEWVEIRNRSREALALDAFTLSDRGGTRGKIRGGVPVPPESLAVLAQDRAALLARFPALDSTRVWQPSPWASLNNSNDASGTADGVVLREADGVPCARYDYSASGVPAGIPIERNASGVWEPSSDPMGSPLRPPRALADLAGRFEVSPRRIGGASHGTRLSWSLPWPRARVGAELYAFSGSRVGAVLNESVLPGRGEREWNATGIGPGIYVLVFQARPENGGEGLQISRVIRVEEAR
jgi:hypothetical protein